jgi:hypothetical protein
MGERCRVRLAGELRFIAIAADEQDACPRRNLVNQEIARERTRGHAVLSSNEDAVESVCNNGEFYEARCCQTVAATKRVT